MGPRDAFKKGCLCFRKIIQRFRAGAFGGMKLEIKKGRSESSGQVRTRTKKDVLGVEKVGYIQKT